VQAPPTLDPGVALRALERQLAALDALKGRRCVEAADEESEWEQLTQSIIERAFGKDSTNVGTFHSAGWAGSHAVRDVYEYRDLAQDQVNYDLRQRAFASLLRGLIAELKLLVPSEDIRGTYQAGDAYAFYRDLSSLIVAGTREMFIVDPYIDESVFNLYVDKVSAGTSLRILTSNVVKNVVAVATLYAKGKPLQMRSSSGIHDRAVFIDERGWLVGQSLKDAAHKKPTTVTELLDPTHFRDANETIWAGATIVV
jgi:hypothetical protein